MTGPALALMLAIAMVSRAAPAATPVEQLNTLVEDYFERKLELTPLTATFIGDERYNDRVENPASPAYVVAQKSLSKACLAGAEQIESRRLDTRSRLTYEVLLYECQLTLQSSNYPGLLLPIDQTQSIASVMAGFGTGKSAQPFRTVKDYEDFIKRCRSTVDWINQSIVSLREGLERGITQPRVAMEKVVPQLRAVGVDKPENSLFWGAIQSMPASIQEPDRGRIIQAYRAELANDLLPAYRRLADYIEKDYLLRARNSVSWSALPNGAAWYQHLVRLQTTTTMTPEEIHELGLKEVARIRSEMEAVKARLGFEGDLRAFFKHVQTDPKLYYSSPEELRQGFRELRARVQSTLPKLFSIYSRTDDEMRALEPLNVRAQPKFGMESLMLREVAPGRELQLAIQRQLKSLPRFRRYGSLPAYQDGWALYASSIGKELGLFSDPYQEYGRLSDEMLRAMSLVVDTGLHSKDWTREQAIAYMLESSSMTESDVVAEVDRCIVRPAQALGAKVGQLRLSALRAKAEKQLGPRFDVKTFHTVILRDGPLPLDLLEKKVDRWLRQTG